jgi:hypothetical protein
MQTYADASAPHLHRVLHTPPRTISVWPGVTPMPAQPARWPPPQPEPRRSFLAWAWLRRRPACMLRYQRQAVAQTDRCARGGGVGIADATQRTATTTGIANGGPPWAKNQHRRVARSAALRCSGPTEAYLDSQGNGGSVPLPRLRSSRTNWATGIGFLTRSMRIRAYGASTSSVRRVGNPARCSAPSSLAQAHSPWQGERTHPVVLSMLATTR